MLAKLITKYFATNDFARSIRNDKKSIVWRVRKEVGLMNQRPFRSPHHDIHVALVGGGSYPQPGEISDGAQWCFILMNCLNLRDVSK
jgi:magnesium chelatase family protein